VLTREAFDQLAVELMCTDEADEPGRLAEIGWRLYGVLAVNVAESERLRAALWNGAAPDARAQPRRRLRRSQHSRGAVA
jgi:hypothetical protein